MTAQKDWRVDIFPLIFFAIVVAAKTYYLIGYIAGNEQLWELLQDDGRRASLGNGAAYFLTGQFSYIGYYIVSTAFDALVFYSLVVRGAAKDRPKGFWENVFPLITVFVPVFGFAAMFMPQVRAVLPGYPEPFLRWLAELTPAFPFYMNLAGLLIGLFGAAFSIWAIAHLRASFGLRTAVRELITTGPYSRIRHPLYFGEMIHIFGVAILAATPAAMYLYLVAVILQVIRAKIEERKFLATVPAYADFRRRTGFLWPRLF
ncbi:MAG: isoprenylcysteine carboxylmethyltransferase family protein [Chromatiaceae bacterium]|nr:isoprenylcysteine carboxylmethyltransferase family protein [Gammaproteobacteria bacterium]MCP5304322.1 isoprenylcysteine carboxylmethyltransferase family protein [Chromatiaceae bacterium]MCP5314047.1 isoprenylcysteine carboxylmethyltransferase family protein [Chromatiaceae bacterium]